MHEGVEGVGSHGRSDPFTGVEAWRREERTWGRARGRSWHRTLEGRVKDNVEEDVVWDTWKGRNEDGVTRKGARAGYVEENVREGGGTWNGTGGKWSIAGVHGEYFEGWYT